MILVTTTHLATRHQQQSVHTGQRRAAEIAASPGPHAGKTYWPTGPERLSYADAAREEQKQAMINAGLPEVVADDNAKALTLFADGDADYVTDDVPALLGRPARSFEQFVTDFAVAFS